MRKQPFFYILWTKKSAPQERIKNTVKKVKNILIFLLKTLDIREVFIYNREEKEPEVPEMCAKGRKCREEESTVAKIQGKELRKFDQVNRMSLPPKYKKMLGEEIVVFKPIHGEPCVMLFSEKGWDDFCENIIEGFVGADQAEAERRIADRSDNVTPDKSNRITIREDFMDFAGLTDEVLAVGVGDRVELWNPDRWLARFGEEKKVSDEEFFSSVSYARPRSKS